MLAVLVLVSYQTLAEVRLPSVFSSNMVLQQNKEVAIWGWASPGEQIKITGSWNNKTVDVKTNSGAKWMTLLQTPIAGGPYVVTIEGENTIILENVLIGEVWVCSGQSNMESSATHSYSFNNAKEEISNANYPKIRLFQVEKATSDTKQEDLTGTWTLCSPETMKGFSGTAYFFARELQNKLDIPIGLIHSSWGGTAAEVWMDKVVIDADPAFLEKAFKLNVTVATPTSMMALLRTIGYIFTRNKLADNADEIQKVANTFLKNITLLHGKIVAVGKAISSTAKAYEDLIPTAEKTVLSPARRIHNLGVLGDKEKLAIEYPESPIAVRELRSISADDDFIEVEEIEVGEDE